MDQAYSSRYPFPIIFDEETLNELVENAVDWAHGHGLVMRTADHKDRSDICQTAPFTLLPSPFPRTLFQEAVDIQKATNLLYFRISSDYEFLLNAHADVIKTDDFTRHFVEILKHIRDVGLKQPKTLLIQRADYMCDERVAGSNDFKLRQVEVNNIAASMGWLSEMTSCLHRRTLQDLGISNEIIDNFLPLSNQPIDTIAEGIYDAWLDFGDAKSLILFIVEDVNQNQLDQRHVEYRVDQLSARQAKCIRLTLTECAHRLTLGGTTGYELLLNKNERIAIVYFRAGYSPSNYPSELEWNARLQIELSTAIKCPWIGLQLANTKKIQQVLAEEGQLEKFLPEAESECARIRATFAGLWGLENDDVLTRDIIKTAIEHPERFVLKPQLEGGGGNYYGDEISTKLKQMNVSERAAHILMERIRPMVVKNYLIRPFESVELNNIVGELGVYGCLYGEMKMKDAKGCKDECIMKNISKGHIIRSKCEHIDKGGVAIGAAVIDSPLLI